MDRYLDSTSPDLLAPPDTTRTLTHILADTPRVVVTSTTVIDSQNVVGPMNRYLSCGESTSAPSPVDAADLFKTPDDNKLSQVSTRVPSTPISPLSPFPKRPPRNRATDKEEETCR